MRWLLFALILIHGLIHLLGFAKAFGFAELPQLTQPISRSSGLGWLGAAVAHLAAAVLLVDSPRIWWAVAFVAVALSQWVIITSWSDAKFGTLANIVILLAAIYGFAAYGPPSFRAEYRSSITELAADAPDNPATVRRQDLASLPVPVRCWMERVGVVGQPHVHHFSATWDGRIRSGPDEDWMEFTAQQVVFVGTADADRKPARFYLMDARRGGLPVDVLHSFRDAAASMRVRLLSLVPMVSQGGPEMTRAETVTLLNDMALMAPGALLDTDVEWTQLGERSARARYTLGENTVEADLEFDQDCNLVNFISDDRLAATSHGAMIAQRWSTPLRDHRDFGPYHLPSAGEAFWDAPDGSYAYMEADIESLEVNGPVP